MVQSKPAFDLNIVYPLARHRRQKNLVKAWTIHTPSILHFYHALLVIIIILYCCRVADDIYFVYCALSNGSLLVTNDLLGDYHCKLPPPLGKVFKKWQRCHQVQLVQQHNRTDLQVTLNHLSLNYHNLTLVI